MNDYCVECYEMLDKIFGRNKREIKKGSSQDNFNNGVKHIEKKEFQPAIQSFKRCIQEDPEDSKAYIGLCIAYSGLMDLETARRYYAELKDLDPYLAAQFANTPTGSILEDNEDVLI